MILFVSIVHILVCLILVSIILLQPGRGMGLTGSALSDSSTQSVFGTKTADVLTKATTVAAVLFMVTCIGLSALTARKSRSLYADFKDQAPITMNQIQKAVKEAEKKAADEKANAGKSVESATVSAQTAVAEATTQAQATLPAGTVPAVPAVPEEPKAA